MATSPIHPWVEIEKVGEVLVVRFSEAKLLEEQQIHLLGDQLFGLVEQGGCRKLVLNFSRVVSLVSTMLAKLVLLNKKMKSAGGRLVLCGFEPNIEQIIHTLKLHRLLTIGKDEQDAMQSFS